VKTPEPGSPNECECTEREFLLPYTCSLHANYCSCLMYFPDRCPPGKCDYSFQCGDTLYACWNLISPVNLGVCLDNDCEDDASLLQNDQVQSIEYCYDGKDNDLDVVGINCGQLCSLNPNVLDNAPDQILGKEICPNGEMVQRYSKSCAPDGANGSGSFDSCRRSEAGDFVLECEMPFCNYGVDGPFRSIVFPFIVLEEPTVLDDLITGNQDPTVLNQPSKKPTKKEEAKKGMKKVKVIAKKGTGTVKQKVKPVKGKTDSFQHKRKLLRNTH
jgi:hypothetical protein